VDIITITEVPELEIIVPKTKVVPIETTEKEKAAKEVFELIELEADKKIAEMEKAKTKENNNNKENEGEKRKSVSATVEENPDKRRKIDQPQYGFDWQTQVVLYMSLSYFILTILKYIYNFFFQL
jgi:hypothetical protein